MVPSAAMNEIPYRGWLALDKAAVEQMQTMRRNVNLVKGDV
jgi:hypothetical protein